MDIIKAENLSLAYDGKIAAEDINFSLPEGGYMCIIGENGSGKSTLLKAIIGDITPYRGTLHLSDEIKKHGIGYLPQQSKIQRDFPANVKEVILSGCINRDKFGIGWKSSSLNKAKENAELLGISSLLDKPFGDLSGGQKQRVLLARALCASDKLLLLDEPLTGLDPDAAHEMYDSISKINYEKKCAVIMVTHDVNCALKEASLVLSLCRGHSFFGTVDEYSEHELVDEAIDSMLHSHSHSHHTHAHHEGGHTHAHN